MASIVIRKLDDRIKSRLKMQAAAHGRSMEEEVREILRCTLAEDEARRENLGQAIRRKFSELGGVELRLPKRTPPREPPDFSR